MLEVYFWFPDMKKNAGNIERNKLCGVCFMWCLFWAFTLIFLRAQAFCGVVNNRSLNIILEMKLEMHQLNRFLFKEFEFGAYGLSLLIHDKIKSTSNQVIAYGHGICLNWWATIFWRAPNYSN